MKSTLVSLLVVTLGVALISAAPLQLNASNTTVPTMGEALMAMLQQFKHIAPCGDATIGMPAHQPLRMWPLNLDINNEFLVLNGSVDNMLLTGLVDFVIIQMATNVSTNRTTFDILFKDVQLLGDYDMYVNADLAGYTFITTVQGLMNLQLLNVRLTSGMTLGVNSVGGVKMSDVEVAVQVGDVNSYIFDSQWSVPLNNFINEYIHDATLLWLQTNRVPINNIVSNWASGLLNKGLANVTDTQFVMSMVNLSKTWKATNCTAT